MLKVKSLTPKIILISADTQAELNEAFVRFEEYYESPEWKGKIFTLGQYRKWYAETNGAFSYLTDWSGFNLPSDNFKPFIQGLFDPLTPNEQQIVNWFKDRTDTFAVIGAMPDGKALEHEICHALWATNEDYKQQCLDIVDAIPVDQFFKLKAWILKAGYNESVVQDEVHAYVSADRNYMLEKHNIDINQDFQDQLRAVKAKFYIAPKKD